MSTVERTTAACPEGIRRAILPVGMVTCAGAVEHADNITLSDLSLLLYDGEKG